MAEKERKKEHSISLQNVQAKKYAMRKADTHRTKTQKNQSVKQEGRISVAEMLVFGRYLMKLKKDQLSNVETLKALQVTEKEKRDILMEASKQRKIYDKLKENQSKEFYDGVSKLENKELEEIAVSNHRLKKVKS